MDHKATIENWLNHNFYKHKPSISAGCYSFINSVPSATEIAKQGPHSEIFQALVGTTMVREFLRQVQTFRFNSGIMLNYASHFSGWDYNQEAPQILYTFSGGGQRFLGLDLSREKYDPTYIHGSPDKPMLVVSWPLPVEYLGLPEAAQMVAEGENPNALGLIRRLNIGSIINLVNGLRNAAIPVLAHSPKIEKANGIWSLKEANPNAHSLLKIFATGVFPFPNPQVE